MFMCYTSNNCDNLFGGEFVVYIKKIKADT